MKIVFDTREFLEKAWRIAEKISISSDVNTQFKGAMLYSTFNICDAMQILIQKKNFVSANILFRSLFEYVFRAYWLNRIACEEEVLQAMNDEKWPKTKSLHDLIAGKNSIIDVLASEKLKIQDILHSYIHGGSQNPLGQLGAGGYIEPHIPDSEVSYLLSMIQLNTYVILSEMAHLSGSTEIEAEIVQIMEELVGEKII
ncbi:MAG: DUF5677 domain-containing protein [Sedimenticola sp.]